MHQCSEFKTKPYSEEAAIHTTPLISCVQMESSEGQTLYKEICDFKDNNKK
jgi:hypothetical protein